MNVEVGQEAIEELESAFRFNDAVIRNLIIRRDAAETGNSKLYEEELREQEKIGNAIAGDKKKVPHVLRPQNLRATHRLKRHPKRILLRRMRNERRKKTTGSIQRFRSRLQRPRFPAPIRW